jgi:exodeoxyribonuclease VII large subunit
MMAAAGKEFPFGISSSASDNTGQGDKAKGGDPKRPLKVGELTRRIKRSLEDGFGRVWVEGEISNWRPGPSGHVYFALKDSDALLSCVMWRSTAQKILAAKGAAKQGGATFSEGVRVEAKGQLSVYEPRGSYQLVVTSMQQAGLGDLYREFLERKERLQKEGLFEAERKRPLPVFPHVIGLVTSPHGAAARDVLTVLRRRFPGVRVVLQGARVQGDMAAGEIAEALRQLSLLKGADRPDVIICGRGGGSIEDLWAFNEEIVVRAIAASPIPVVSAVGHEVDSSLADFAADRYAPTPSAAAELVVTTLADWQRRYRRATRSLIETTRYQVAVSRGRLMELVNHRAFEEPRTRIQRYRQQLDENVGQLNQLALKFLPHRRDRLQRKQNDLLPALQKNLRERRQRLESLEQRLQPLVTQKLHRQSLRMTRAINRLQSMNPRQVLTRGYAIVTAQRGTKEKIISDARKAPRGKKLRIEFADGRIGAISEGPEDQGFQLGLEFDAPKKK